MPTQEPKSTTDLPPDNASRLAIYDALCARANDAGATGITNDELFDAVIARLRVLVPRELHLIGEREYLDNKIRACAAAGILLEKLENGFRLLTPAAPPQIRYPDGQVRDYSAGLEVAREQLEQDNSHLRAVCFDVRKLIPSTADDPNGPQFQALLSSMSEHGYMKQFPIVRNDDGVVIDGRARLRAADMLQLDVEYLKYGSDRERTAARRRDTPLNRVMVAVQSNSARLSAETIDNVHAQVAAATGRPWSNTMDDLVLTQGWRRSISTEYSPIFEVTLHAYRERDQARVQVTKDDKVMVRSLIEAGGLSNYKLKLLRDHVPFERARSAHSAGRKAVFARTEDMITGITTMLDDRRAAGRKIDPEWEQIRDWLVRKFGSPSN